MRQCDRPLVAADAAGIALREKQEAERKRVEAVGIEDFQDIITQEISEKLLEWKGIEATMELVKTRTRR